MSEPRGSRILGAVLPVVIIGVVLFGFWAVLSMAFAGDGGPSTSILFAIGSILLGAVAIATALWLVRSVGTKDATSAVTPPAVDSEPPAA
jgi:nitrogen fixation-related uncharacterized protein